MIKGATPENLKTTISNHLGETKNHVARLENVFISIGEKAVAKKCLAMLVANQFQEKEVLRLLLECYDEAQEDKELFNAITANYLYAFHHFSGNLIWSTESTTRPGLKA